MPAPSPEKLSQPLAGHLVVFSGKLSSLGHRDARALVARLGGDTAEDVTTKTTIVVIGGESVGAGDKTIKLKRAEELNGQRDEQIRILKEDEFCVLAGVPTIEALKRQYHATRDLLARYRSLREDHLRYLIKWGIIKPIYRTNTDTFFDFSALGAIKQANDDVAQGHSFRSAVRDLLALREGQLTFDFRLDAAPARVLALAPRPAPPTASAAEPTLTPPRDTALAEEYFKVGSALDNGDDSMKEQAATAYRRALELDPYLSPR
jgi:hypothetical protein